MEKRWGYIPDSFRQYEYRANKTHAADGMGCGGNRKIISLFELS